MNTLLLQLASFSGAFGSGESVEAVEAALRDAAGIVVRSEALGDTSGQAFDARGLPRIEWVHDPSSTLGVEFLNVPGTEGFFAAPPVGARENAESGWRWELEVPSWSLDQTTLLLKQVGSSATAEGEISLAVPRRLREKHALETVEVLDILSGCAMFPAFEVPFTLTHEVQHLRFDWDLHSVVNIGDVYMTLESRDVELPRIPIHLEVEAEPVMFDHKVLEFDCGQTVRLGVRAGSDRTLDITRITCPPCVRITETEALDGGLRFWFEECPIAARRHHCGAIEFESLVGDDPEPFLREVAIVHRRGLLDEDGSRPVFGAFAPGERIAVIRERDGRLRLTYPDRIPCMAEITGESDSVLEASYQIPLEGRALDVHVQGESGVLHLRGLIDSKVVQNLPKWIEHCTD
jgi:hypothetical protein